MATVDWAVVCDLAYFDRANRVCLIGIEATSPTRIFAVGKHRLAIVVHLRDVDPDDDLDPALFVVSPGGEWTVADNIRDFAADHRGDYVIVDMPDVPLLEEGIHRFEIALGTSAPTVFELSVLAKAQHPLKMDVHGAY